MIVGILLKKIIQIKESVVNNNIDKEIAPNVGRNRKSDQEFSNPVSSNVGRYRKVIKSLIKQLIVKNYLINQKY